MQRIWFIADTHFDNSNIIKYSHRPFKDANDMNNQLIARWNEKISPNDLVYHLGDVSFSGPKRTAEFIKQLHGKKFLIKGNHDKLKNKDYYDFGFHWVGDYKKITVNGQKIILSHYAMRAWDSSHHGSWMLYGHSHGNLRDHFYYNEIDQQYYPIQRTMDVGVDKHNFYPYSFDEINEIMKTQSISYENSSVENELKGK